MDSSQRAALWIVATGVIAAGLYVLRGPLTQFALALILWLAIDGLTRTLRRRLPFLPGWLALPIALLLVLSFTTLTAVVVVANISAMAGNYAVYEARLNEIIAQAYAMLGLNSVAPTVANLIARLDPSRVAAEFGQGLQALASDAVFILIYLGFLFPAGRVISRKITFIFGRGAEREAAREVFSSIRESMERYLWVQTVMSLIITVLTYVTLLVFGVSNALFWSFLIFFLNFIPTIGSIAASVLIFAVALVQFTDFTTIAAVTLIVSAWQFLIGNFVQPRMTGDSLNLSAIVVLLALAIWGLIWGIAGAFLAAPLTVMLMIVLAQFRSTRWIAIILSADGKPTPRDALLSNSDSASN